MNRGGLNRRIRIERRADLKDAAGQPVGVWQFVGEIWAGVANETGMGAIRSAAQGGVPLSIARYSFLVDFQTARALGIDAGMRVIYDGDAFDVKGLTRDFASRQKAFIVTEQGGNAG